MPVEYGETGYQCINVIKDCLTFFILCFLENSRNMCLILQTGC